VVDLELQCDPSTATATLKATANGAADTIAGIPLPVFPYFNLHTPGNSATVEILP
jgi:hypothetical protein